MSLKKLINMAIQEVRQYSLPLVGRVREGGVKPGNAFQILKCFAKPRYPPPKLPRKRGGIHAVLLLLGFLFLTPHSAHADQAEVKEIARNNGCPPKKIDIYQQSLGSEGRTIYRVQCNMPKVADDASKGPDELLISCRDSLCELLRPFQEEQKK